MFQYPYGSEGCVIKTVVPARSNVLMGAVLMLGLLYLTSPVPAFAENFFSWNGDTTQIIVEGQAERCIDLRGSTTLDTSEKHSGSASIRHKLSGYQRAEGCDPSATAFAGDVLDGDDAYMRWWMKIGTDMNWGPYFRQAKFARMTRTNEKVPSFTTLHLGHSYLLWGGAFNERGSDEYHYLRVDFDPKDGECKSSRLIGSLGKDCTQWREYILHYKRNSCIGCKDSFLRFYVDGQLADEVEGISFANFIPDDGVTTFKYAWGGAGGQIFPQLCPNGESNCGAGGTIWIDDISVDSEWNSLAYEKGGDPGTGDVVRPNPPHSLVIEN